MLFVITEGIFGENVEFHQILLTMRDIQFRIQRSSLKTGNQIEIIATICKYTFNEK